MSPVLARQRGPGFNRYFHWECQVPRTRDDRACVLRQDNPDETVNGLKTVSGGVSVSFRASTRRAAFRIKEDRPFHKPKGRIFSFTPPLSAPPVIYRVLWSPKKFNLPGDWTTTVTEPHHRRGIFLLAKIAHGAETDRDENVCPGYLSGAP